MDKILSAEEWYYRQLSQQNGKTMTNWQIAQAYSTYLLEEFAKEVKNDNKMYFLGDQSIDNLLTKFKEKL